jgi:hypothetical protein
MEFWNTSDGNKVIGDASSVMAPSFMIVPDKTKALAEINEFKFDEDYNCYQIFWLLKSGEFAGALVRQRLEVYSENSKKADRAKNMFARLYKLTGLTPPRAAPTNADVKMFKGHELGILVMQWQSENKETGEIKEGNWINMIYDPQSFEPKDGKFLPPLMPTPPKHYMPAQDDSEDVPF